MCLSCSRNLGPATSWTRSWWGRGSAAADGRRAGYGALPVRRWMIWRCGSARWRRLWMRAMLRGCCGEWRNWFPTTSRAYCSATPLVRSDDAPHRCRYDIARRLQPSLLAVEVALRACRGGIEADRDGFASVAGVWRDGAGDREGWI